MIWYNVTFLLTTLCGINGLTGKDLLDLIKPRFDPFKTFTYNTEIEAHAIKYKEKKVKANTLCDVKDRALRFICPAVVILPEESSLNEELFKALSNIETRWIEGKGEPFIGICWDIFDLKDDHTGKGVQFIVAIYRYIPQGQYPGDVQQLYERALKRHNYYREFHDSLPLTLDEDLTVVAKARAQQLAGRGVPDNSTAAKEYEYGENFFVDWQMSLYSQDCYVTDEVIDKWYYESKYYKNYDNNFPSKDELQKFGAFTRLTWKRTTMVGFWTYYGSFTRPSGLKVHGFWFVAIYRDRGNVDGEFAANVGRPHSVNTEEARGFFVIDDTSPDTNNNIEAA